MAGEAECELIPGCDAQMQMQVVVMFGRGCDATRRVVNCVYRLQLNKWRCFIKLDIEKMNRLIDLYAYRLEILQFVYSTLFN